MRNINQAQQWLQAVLCSPWQLAASQPGTISGAPNLGHSAYAVEVATQHLTKGRAGSILLGYDGCRLAQVLQGRANRWLGACRRRRAPPPPGDAAAATRTAADGTWNAARAKECTPFQPCTHLKVLPQHRHEQLQPGIVPQGTRRASQQVQEAVVQRAVHAVRVPGVDSCYLLRKRALGSQHLQRLPLSSCMGQPALARVAARDGSSGAGTLEWAGVHVAVNLCSCTCSPIPLGTETRRGGTQLCDVNSPCPAPLAPANSPIVLLFS